MRTASELYEFSISQTPILVAKILEGVREHIIESCERDAAQGSTYYNIYLKKGRAFIKEALLDECIKMAKEFERHFEQDRFEDSLHRLCTDAHLIAGNYEKETAIMLIKAFKESKPAYDVKKVLEELEEISFEDICGDAVLLNDAEPIICNGGRV